MQSLKQTTGKNEYKIDLRAAQFTWTASRRELIFTKLKHFSYKVK